MYQINDTINSLFNVVLNLFILSLLALHTLPHCCCPIPAHYRPLLATLGYYLCHVPLIY